VTVCGTGGDGTDAERLFWAAWAFDDFRVLADSRGLPWSMRFPDLPGNPPTEHRRPYPVGGLTYPTASPLRMPSRCRNIGPAVHRLRHYSLGLGPD
jgi:hypothetical protein